MMLLARQSHHEGRSRPSWGWSGPDSVSLALDRAQGRTVASSSTVHRDPVRPSPAAGDSSRRTRPRYECPAGGPLSITRFAEQVVLPIVVISELESKRHHPELGYFAREALRKLDDLRVAYGALDTPVTVNDQGGTLRVELNHSNPEVLPAGFRQDDNDTRILTVARNLAAENNNVVLVSKDLPLRIKASSVGLAADEYRAELAIEHGWTGGGPRFYHKIEELRSGTTDIGGAGPTKATRAWKLVSERGKALGRVLPDKSVKVVRGDRDVRPAWAQRGAAHRP